jgi:hypothetical protein
MLLRYIIYNIQYIHSKQKITFLCTAIRRRKKESINSEASNIFIPRHYCVQNCAEQPSLPRALSLILFDSERGTFPIAKYPSCHSRTLQYRSTWHEYNTTIATFHSTI